MTPLDSMPIGQVMNWMQNEIFVDTGAWIAISDGSDRYHAAAKAIYPQLLSRHRLVTTNLVLSETYILLRKGLGANPALRFLSLVRSSPRIMVAYSTEELEQRAEGFLRKYGDHPLSYTDAVSFTLMEDRGITKAFAFDRHFQIAGFQILPGNS
ncbi:MAG TPA: type II toxin-antitoxin system VapC family toxin [Firmicutes bacterium]|nr:type II toxin-antitoxin system VapC family toxin [Bacillota bacterium]HHY98920.1 type II toxin-antitoxin system VapC family toxin [Bacillota bacterium]